jgi:multiple sugar transport system substrate-binding protein
MRISDDVRTRTRRLLVVPVAVGLMATSLAVFPRAAPASAAASSGGITLTLAASQSYVLDSTALAAKFYGMIKSEFQKQHPGVTVNIENLPGGYNDIVTKLELLYRSPSTAPDVANFNVAQSALFASSGYLAPMNSFLKTASWWKGYSAVTQSEGLYNGKIYSVSQGDTTTGLIYNVKMFRKAGIPVPWHPKTVADIISAAKRLKAALPGVIPFWLPNSTSLGAAGVLQGGLDSYILASSNPTIFDSSTKRWVVDSPGIRQAFGFYQAIAADGLGAPESDLFSPAAGTAWGPLLQDGKLAMGSGANYWPGVFTKTVSAPYWPQAAQTLAAAPIPTFSGKGTDKVSCLSSWSNGIAAASKHKQLAFDLISLMEDRQNMINYGNWAGLVPPNRSTWTDPLYTSFAPYATMFADLELDATPTPAGAPYTVWVQGMEEGTELFVENPRTTVAQAIQTAKSYIAQQLGASQVETLK